MAASDKVQETVAVDLGTLLDAGEGAVVTLLAGETRLAAHKAVLSARSPVFEAMFRHDTLEGRSGEVVIPDVEGAVLRQLLVYLYTLQVPQLFGMALQLLPAADKYCLPALKAACEQQLAAQLSVETAAATAVLAVRHSCTHLRQAAIAFIKAHTHEVMATNGWADAMRAYTEDVVKVSRLLTNPPSETSAGAQSQRQSQHCSGHSKTTAAAAPPMSPPVTPPPEGDAVSHLWSLSSEEKGRRLIRAAKEGREEEVEALLAARADTEARDSDGRTALHCAAEGGHGEAVRRLVGGGAEVDARDCLQQTPLHRAAWRNHTAVVRLLTAASADPNARDEDRWTPLHRAAFRAHTESAHALLEAGADSGARDKWGRTPHDVTLEFCSGPMCVRGLLR